ncbi:isocitrate lyase/PEP mutase family protein [Acidisoma cellulosilytica]|uniref:Isocitrate lyase/PEP mutase family protein n=1 Tax=Acidisoma cellulosilyticum TaxID=2802395 RepID=A0A963Z4Z6_9PROT|nr:isocitrate lyase/PEP mutase family protein [Acidisoma cellulosilyticum]MCB8882636.1 isocitrate lyase/PEP mutase family protein [Acidisoma cellulosilyticum]
MTKTLNDLLQPGAAVLMPGAANALTARIIEDAGFEALIVTGAGIANTYLGMPDIGLTTVTEVADHVARIRDACSLPMIADGDTGFGNPINMQRTIRLFERAGANAIQMEDQTFPKKCGHFEGKHVIPAREMVQKIQAAADARRDANFLLLARTDAYAIEGLSAAIDRVMLYQEAGADLLFVEAPKTAEELRQIPRQAPGRHICNIVFGGKTEPVPQQDLAAMGFAGVLYANAALQAGMLAMTTVLQYLRAHGSLAGHEDAVMPFAQRQQVLRLAEMTELERRYS